MEAGDDRSLHQIVDALDTAERSAVSSMWADELARGWIPKRADVEAALHIVRSRRS